MNEIQDITDSDMDIIQYFPIQKCSPYSIQKMFEKVMN